jgi:LysM domain
LSASLKQYLWIGIIILSSAILFFTFPERAKAQTETPSAASVQDSQNEHSTVAPSTRYVVQTGDSLWSISQQWLGPNATPAQIADEVERIYALNRDQIEDNPNFLPGLELLLPPVPNPAMLEEAAGLEEPTASEEPATSEKPAASEQVVPEPIIDSDTPSDALADQKALSTAPTNEESAPVATSVAASLLRAYNNLSERQLLGLGTLLLTLIVAILMVWKLPMRREIENPTSWAVYQRYYENYALPEPAKELEGESAPVSEALKATQEGPRSTSNPTTTSEEATPVPVDEETRLLSGHRRQERLKRSRHLRKIRQRRQLAYR